MLRLSLFSARICLVIVALSPLSALAEPGRLLDLSPLATYTKKGLDLSKRALDIPESAGVFPSRSGSLAYKVIYETTGLDAKPTRASGLLLVPTETEATRFPVVSYQHGTTTEREGVPSRPLRGPESVAAALVYGSMDLIVTAPDYLGLGDSPGPHPYLHAATEASAARDLLLALPAALKRLGRETNGQLFVAGYSQGGHATLALHRALDENPVPGLQLSGSIGMAGPYDLSGTSLRETLAQREPAPASSAYVAYLLSMLALTDPARVPSLKALVGEHLEAVIGQVLDGKHAISSVMAALPRDPREVFLPEVLAAVLANPEHPLIRALAQNDVYDWHPKEPVLLLHASGDHDVSYANTVKAAATLRGRGAFVVTYDLGADKDHSSAMAPALVGSYKFIARLRRDK